MNADEALDTRLRLHLAEAANHVAGCARAEAELVALGRSQPDAREAVAKAYARLGPNGQAGGGISGERARELAAIHAANQFNMKIGLARIETGQPGLAPETLDTAVKLRAASKEIEKRSDEMVAQAEEARQQPATVKSGTWLRTQKFAPIRWAVLRVVAEGLTIIAGSPKAGKSFLMLAWAMAIASGGPASGFGALPARPVLYFALEDGDRRMQSRCTDLGFAWIPDLFEYVTEAFPAQVILTATAWLEAHPDGVIIIDTLAKVRPARLNGESAYDHDYRTMGTYHTLAKQHPGAAIIIVHHTRKDQSGDFLDSTSGTYGISGSVDTVLVLKRQRGESAGVLHVTGRDVDEEEYRMCGFPFWELDGGTPEAARQSAMLSAERQRLGERSTQIIEFLAQKGEATGLEVARHLGVQSETAGVYLKRLADSGRISKFGRGRWGLLVSPVEYVKSVENIEFNSTDSTNTTGDTRGAIDWQALFDMADHTA